MTTNINLDTIVSDIIPVEQVNTQTVAGSSTCTDKVITKTTRPCGVKVCSMADDAVVVEEVFDNESKKCSYVGYKRDGTVTREVLAIDKGTELFQPIDNALVRKGRVLLPSDATDYENSAALLNEIEEHVRKYVVFPKELRGIVSHYVLFTWIADRFRTYPYLRLIGDFGAGKSRALNVLGDICYKPFKASGCASTSAIFRGLDMFGLCTLLLDETDFEAKNSLHEDIMRMLRVGFDRGGSVMRAEASGDTFDPRSFSVYGPKIIGGRLELPDPALNSRCIRIHMPVAAQLGAVPIELPDSYEAEATGLRNKLLKWRFDHYFTALAQIPDLAIEPRLRQVYGPLASVMEDEGARQKLQAMMLELQSEVATERRQSREGHVLNILQKEARGQETAKIKVASVATQLALLLDDSSITSKTVAAICRAMDLEVGKDRDGALVRFNKSRLAPVLLQYGFIPEEVKVETDTEETPETAVEPLIAAA